MTRLVGIALLVAAAAGCASASGSNAGSTGAPLATGAAAPACQRVNIYWGDRGLLPLEGRASPYDSTTFAIGGQPAKVCYGRPSMRGRQIFGGLVPYDTLWRAGANEPTTIHLPFRAEIAGLAVQPGSYSLYTVPGRDRWTLIVNRSVSQWGEESQYFPEIRAQELGRVPVASATVPGAPTEVFTISAQPAGPNGANLFLEWENTRVTIPIRRL